MSCKLGGSGLRPFGLAGFGFFFERLNLGVILGLGFRVWGFRVEGKGLYLGFPTPEAVVSE